MVWELYNWLQKKNNKDGKIIGVSGVLDSKIIEVYAKKLNSGLDEEYLSVEIFEV